jgi:hypothetical protein
MCFSASVSYGAAAVLVTTGLYAAHHASRLRQPYWVIGFAPIFFGIQQAFEGRVWQMVEAGGSGSALPFALGFLFFSHFLWLWWIPLSSYVIEQESNRRRVFLGTTLFGLLAGTLVYFTLLFNSDLVSVVIDEHHIIYDVSSPYRGPISIGIPPSALYAVIILVPLLFSSHRHIRIFGGLVVFSVVLASEAYGYAFVSVWCFFAAVLSLYLVYMIHQQTRGVAATKNSLPYKF